MKIVFFSRPKPKQFNYVPRYYDERKEQMELIRKKHAEPTSEDSLKTTRQHLQMSWRRPIDRRTRKKVSNLMLLVYLVIIAVIVWLIFT